MSGAEYKDFLLHFKSNGVDTYDVHLISSPSGEGRGILELPFRLADLEAILPRMGVLVNDSEGEGGGNTLGADTTPLDLGIKLFQALFSGDIHRRYEDSLRETRGRLRIRLQFDPRDPGSAQLSRMPWEFMRDPATQKPLVLTHHVSLIRYLEKRGRFKLEPVSTPIRILCVIANPSNPRVVDVQPEKVRAQMRQALNFDEVELVFLEKATLHALAEKLHEPFQIIHFHGHGGLVQDKWCLGFEDEDGGLDAVPGEALAITLEPVLDHLRLITLVSCDSARVEIAPHWNPFDSIAQNLVLSGEVPAVAAMQYPLSFQAAFAFSPAFYRRLAQGDSLEAAVNEGRRAIYRWNIDSLEWGTPVLYTRLPDGRLFHMASLPSPDETRLSEPMKKGHPLHSFPLAPMVPSFRIPQILINEYARGFSDPLERLRLVRSASRFRLEADPQASPAAYIEGYELPTNSVQALDFWDAVFLLAGKKSPRMLAALLLAEIQPALTERASAEREKLLNYLKRIDKE